MANYSRVAHEGRVVKLSTPSQFGSHKSMVIEDLGGGKFLLQDDRGTYLSSAQHIDSGLSDPNRNSFSERGIV